MSGHLAHPRTDRTSFPVRYLLHPLRPIARFLLRRRYRIVQHHPERVPVSGPVIFAANHVGIIDGPLLAIFAPRPVHALTKIEMFKGKLGTFLLKSGQIPLERFTVDVAAIRISVRVLRDGGAVGIFPEGTRGAGEFRQIAQGAVYLAMVTGAPIVPVVMVGTRDPGGGSSSIPSRGSRLEMVYGEPYFLDQVPWPRTRAVRAHLTDELGVRLRQELVGALELTGRTLPGPLPKSDRDAEDGPTGTTGTTGTDGVPA